MSSFQVLMFMGSQCSYCGPMIQQLNDLMKAGKLADLRIINIEQQPEYATELGVRSVPWLKIGPFTLEGVRSKAELEQWLERADGFSKGEQAAAEYFEEVLASGDIQLAENILQEYPDSMTGLLQLLGDADAKINVRLGIGVILEQQADTNEFEQYIPQLIDYLKSEDARVRGDATHYLSLTGKEQVVPHIKTMLNDDSEEVREIAQDSLEELEA